MSHEPVTPARWLARPWSGSLPFAHDINPIPEAPTPTTLQVLACLAGKNGGRFEVTGWGVTQSGGPYGIEGLMQGEALCLMQMSAFYRGLLEGNGQAHDSAPFEAEWNRVAALRSGDVTNSPTGG